MPNNLQSYQDVRTDFYIQVCGVPIKPGSDIVCMKSPHHDGDTHCYYTFYTRSPYAPSRFNSGLKKRALRSLWYGNNFAVIYTQKEFKVTEQLLLFPSAPKTIKVRGWSQVQVPFFHGTTSMTTTNNIYTYGTSSATYSRTLRINVNQGFGYR